jgi:hypothetical protein
VCSICFACFGNDFFVFCVLFVLHVLDFIFLCVLFLHVLEFDFIFMFYLSCMFSKMILICVFWMFSCFEK